MGHSRCEAVFRLRKTSEVKGKRGNLYRPEDMVENDEIFVKNRTGSDQKGS